MTHHPSPFARQDSRALNFANARARRARREMIRDVNGAARDAIVLAGIMLFAWMAGYIMADLAFQILPCKP